ncbi:putative bifunctional diguanylate cyclase/phosphodiesterase [Halopseudomonas sp.]|uniref:putative bifunctional diguanylate cyclase/phosphodiesterase n=1 Tax=Halopseudomonas sp. TaxID=2901191 RepID=UPI003002568E
MVLTWFPDASRGQQMAIATIVTGMISAGSFVLSPLPYASISYTVIYSFAAIGALWLSAQTVYVGVALLVLLYSPMVLIGSLVAWRQSTDLIAAKAQSERQEHEMSALLQDFEHNAGDALWETGLDGKLNHVSPRLTDVLLLRDGEHDTDSFQQLLGVRCPDHLTQLAVLSSAGQAFRELRLTMPRPDGDKTLLMTGKCLYSVNGAFLGWRGVLTDVTDKVKSEHKLRELAHTDSLTGLANRFHLREALNRAIEHDQPLALLCIDLDRFKAVNDNYGHSVGDSILRVVARRLRSCVGENALIARLGGDEFAIALWSTNGVEAAQALACKVVESVSEPITLAERQFRIGASVGFTVRHESRCSLDDLLVESDIAMYAAKESGRGRWVAYSPQLGEASRRRLSIEHGLRHAIDNGEISLYWQPKVDLQSWQITGAEALMRWQHPELGSISPMEFIPIAEQCGMIDRLDIWALNEACRAGTNELSGLTIAVNVSASQFQFGDYLSQLKTVLKNSGMPAEKLELELTESVLIEDADQAMSLLNDIRLTGVRLALDDFGTGYSSLSYLRRFPFDTLKIDRSFVTELLSKVDARAIVRMITALSRELGKRTVCEGVETEEQLQLIWSAGCHEIQGYLISPPCPLDVFPRSLDPALSERLQRNCVGSMGASQHSTSG